MYIYYLFIKYSFLEMTAFRLSFYNSLFSHLAWGSFTFIVMFLLTSRTKSVQGWTREELFLLTAIFNIMIGIFRTTVAKNMDRFAWIIHFGKLDQYLIKPVDAQFWMSFRYVNIGAFFRIPVAIGITFYLLHLLRKSPGFLDFFLFLFLLIAGLLIIYSIWLMIMTLTIWFTNLMNLKALLDQFTGLTRYPREIFDNLVLFSLLVFMPFTLVVSVPTKFLLGKADKIEVVALFFFAFLFFFLSRTFWKFALRYYTSASG